MKRRAHVNKKRSSRRFRKQTSKTRAINIGGNIMRGGIRL